MYYLKDKVRAWWTNESETTLEGAVQERELARLESGELFSKIRLHDLRHFHASVLIVKHRMSPVEVADRLGHTNPSFTLNVYTHLFDEQGQGETVSLLDFLPKSRAIN